jgi:aminopeptidase-like protein
MTPLSVEPVDKARVLPSDYDELAQLEGVGEEMYALAEALYPICRSITGDGVRKTLSRLGHQLPFEVSEVATGTQVFDWTVPREWNIRDAYIKNEQGERLVDFQRCNLHVLNYSVPIHRKMSLDELRPHLFTLPDRPEWIPYRTSYYNETWGFCVSHKLASSLEASTYEVCIDSSLEDGHLSYGEYVLKGETADEILLSAHVCHPSLANDNLSGIALLTCLGKYLGRINRKHTYRLLLIPGTIGSLTWLALNEGATDRIKHGLVISCVGDSGGPTYKRSRRGNADIDKAVAHVLNHSGKNSDVRDFSPYGYDERQFCSPGFNLPVGLFERSAYGEFPEYHTSADNLCFIQPQHLNESFQIVARVMQVLDQNAFYVNTRPKGEPQLGKRGLYEAIGGSNEKAQRQLAMLWVLNQSDGSHSLLDIAERAKIPFHVVRHQASRLEAHDLLRPC